ncbi:MAG TPA: outer membrane beta-barrel protein [Candidatus Methanoperedens sp.]|nr:outer membrane beta-barrel protein [Candidatus Methanoperedens sp.]
MNGRACRVTVVGLALALGILAAPAAVRSEDFRPWYSGFYVGVAPGYSDVRIPGRSLRMEGIEFNDVRASEGNAGLKLYAGYWINDNIGFELSSAQFSEVNATFDYFQPPAERGTGETKVSLYGSGLTLQLGQRFGRAQVFGRGGVLFWNTSYDSNFFLANGQRQDRLLDKSGTSFTYGLGATWNITGNWNLRLEGDIVEIDITDAKMVSLGLEYRWQ